MNPLISGHATVSLTDIPWDKGQKVASSLSGMWGGAIALFPEVLLFTSDTDIDTDGPGGSRSVDPDWEPGTSLTDAGGHYCNSREFPGVVIPPAFLSYVHKGDYGLCAYNGRIRGFQVYDTGPKNKVGEISIYLGRQLLIIPPSQSDHIAATVGNKVPDLTTAIFRHSGPGHAVACSIIAQTAEHFWKQFTGQDIDVRA